MKFQAIRFGKLLDPHNYIDTNSNDKAFTQNVKDLEIIILVDLSFDDHINIITAKGKQMGAGYSESLKAETSTSSKRS